MLGMNSWRWEMRRRRSLGGVFVAQNLKPVE